jgi:hypothetical protein
VLELKPPQPRADEPLSRRLRSPLPPPRHAASFWAGSHRTRKQGHGSQPSRIPDPSATSISLATKPFTFHCFFIPFNCNATFSVSLFNNARSDLSNFTSHVLPACTASCEFSFLDNEPIRVLFESESNFSLLCIVCTHCVCVMQSIIHKVIPLLHYHFYIYFIDKLYAMFTYEIVIDSH